MLAGNLPQFFSYLRVFQLLSGQVTELLTILDICFTGVANTTSTPTDWKGKGWMGCHKVTGKGYSNTENSQMEFTVAIFTSTYCITKCILSYGQTHQPVMWWISASCLLVKGRTI